VALVVLGVVAIAGGWYFGIATLPGTEQSADNGRLMFPGLAAKLQQATRIEVVHQGKPMVIEKRSVNGTVRWGLADRAGYPVQETKLRAMLTALTELRLVEKRTADPDEYATLGVEDADTPQSNSNLVRILDASGQPILALIVGHRRVRSRGDVPDEVYVRRPGEKQSWLAEGSLEVDSDPQLWLDRDIMNIDHGRIAKVVVTRGGETLAFARSKDKLAMTEPAEHPKLEGYKLEDVSRALELLTFQDVQPDKGTPADALGSTVFSTDDGLTVTASLYRAPPDAATKPVPDRDVLARFSVTGVDKAQAEAARLQAQLSGWTYELGAWKQASLLPSMDDLKAAAKPATPASASMPGAAVPGGSLPGASLPGASLPGASLPKVAAPKAATPGPAAPQVAAPKVAAPKVAAPGVAAPGAAAPGVARP
jgi:hypothetical protein